MNKWKHFLIIAHKSWWTTYLTTRRAIATLANHKKASLNDLTFYSMRLWKLFVSVNKTCKRKKILYHSYFFSIMMFVKIIRWNHYMKQLISCFGRNVSKREHLIFAICYILHHVQKLSTGKIHLNCSLNQTKIRDKLFQTHV